MAEHWMEILRPGEWNGVEFSVEMLREVQASYDPAVREAPIVLGHPDPFGDEKPAYGWVQKLEIRKIADAETDDDISLWALSDLGEEAEGFIRDRKFPKRSVGLGKGQPYEGIWYLNHLALLGASNPAATHLEEVKLQESFTAEDGILVTLSVNDQVIELAWESKDKEYWYRTRPPTRFEKESFKSVDIKGVGGLRAVMGKLKSQYVPEGGKADSMVIQALRFDKKEFDLAKAKAWVTSHKKELSRMSDDTITLNSTEEITELKAQNAKLEAQMKETVDDAKAQKVEAEEAKAELETIRLASLEGKFEHELQALIGDGNGVPAYIDAGVHKALVAVDGIDVELKDGTTKKASAVFLDVLKAMPKVIESKEVAGVKAVTTELSTEIPTDNRFGQAMAGYAAEGKTVVGADLVALADKIEKDEKCTPIEAARKAILLSGQGGK